MKDIRPIKWNQDDPFVELLEQRLLPHEEKWLKLTTHQEMADAIRDMSIRGAPAIGTAAAFGVALGVMEGSDLEGPAREEHFDNICKTLAESRPTARNLFDSLERMKALFEKNKDKPFKELCKIMRQKALAIATKDEMMCRAIGLHGASLLETDTGVLTHCNAGALATTAYGTALGVIRGAWEQGKRFHVYADETRPYLQGARLTAWELHEDGIPVTVIPDNTAGYLMRKGKIHAVVVGADRIARNGDTANKIGTYTVAVLAKEHNIPFYVAAPSTTIDTSMDDGDGIPIEERASKEVTEIHGKSIVPEGVEALYYGFDITPAKYITAIVTEDGVQKPPFDFKADFKK